MKSVWGLKLLLLKIGLSKVGLILLYSSYDEGLIGGLERKGRERGWRKRERKTDERVGGESERERAISKIRRESNLFLEHW